MKVTPTALPDVLLVEPKIFRDGRGFFLESWQRERFGASGISVDFVQDNHSRSVRGTLRGLHYQVAKPQGKLVRVARGEVFDVAVDIRRSSPTFGRWIGERLNDATPRMLWIPPGFAHGFYAMSEVVDFEYKVTEYWRADQERVIRWNDPAIGIDWPILADTPPLLTERDAHAPALRDVECFP